MSAKYVSDEQNNTFFGKYSYFSSRIGEHNVTVYDNETVFGRGLNFSRCNCIIDSVLLMCAFSDTCTFENLLPVISR